MSAASSLEAARYEARIVGLWVLALPAFVAGLFTIAAGMMAFKQAQHIDIQHMVMTGMEGALPLVAGIGVATIVAHEPALELQLSMPLPYRRVALVRCGLLLALTVFIEGGVIFVLARAWPWALSKDGGAWLLAWLPTLLWFAGWGALLALLLRSRAASAAILGVIWVIELAFHGILSAVRLDNAALCVCHDVLAGCAVLVAQPPGVTWNGNPAFHRCLALSQQC